MFSRYRRHGIVAVAVILTAISLSPPAISRVSAGGPDGATGGVIFEPSSRSVDPDPSELAWKFDLVAPDTSPSGGGITPHYVCEDPYSCGPSIRTLSISVTRYIVEPEGSGYDDQHHTFTDSNYWNFCVPGAAAVLTYYWKSSNVTAWPAGNFKEPYGPHISTTYWKSSDTGTSSDTSNGYATQGRAYLMYMAEQVKPPNWSTAGIVDFSTYPSAGANFYSLRDAVNWEISNHTSTGYFYARVKVDASFTQGDLHNAVVLDVTGLGNNHGGFGVPVAVSANTHYLPNWPPNKYIAHAITIVGYNDQNLTYTYVDTCGKRCGSTSNGGTHTISQSQLYTAIRAASGYGWGELLW